MVIIELDMFFFSILGVFLYFTLTNDIPWTDPTSAFANFNLLYPSKLSLFGARLELFGPLWKTDGTLNWISGPKVRLESSTRLRISSSCINRHEQRDGTERERGTAISCQRPTTFKS